MNGEWKTYDRQIDDALRQRIAYWEGVIIGQDIILKFAAPGTQREEAAHTMRGYADNEISFLKRLIALHDESGYRHEE